MRLRPRLPAVLRPDPQADRVVPRSGLTAHLTLFAAAAMAFLAVFALMFSLASGRLAARWSQELAGGATIRIAAPQDRQEAQVAAALRVLETTPGVASARVLSEEEQQALLAPWFGEGVDLSELPVPQLIEVVEDGTGLDTEGLRLRLAAEAPAAVLDDHARWREPLVRAAGRLRLVGWLATGLIAATTAAMITLAANAALAANAQVIGVLRLVGATDAYIADAFVRRFTLRAGLGAVFGTAAALVCVVLLATSGAVGGAPAGLLTGLGPSGGQWLLPLLVPPLAALVAYLATRAAAARALEGLG